MKALAVGGAVDIRNQAEHHRKHTFREELGAMLRKHGLDYDERILD